MRATLGITWLLLSLSFHFHSICSEDSQTDTSVPTNGTKPDGGNPSGTKLANDSSAIPASTTDDAGKNNEPIQTPIPANTTDAVATANGSSAAKSKPTAKPVSDQTQAATTEKPATTLNAITKPSPTPKQDSSTANATPSKPQLTLPTPASNSVISNNPGTAQTSEASGSAKTSGTEATLNAKGNASDLKATVTPNTPTGGAPGQQSPTHTTTDSKTSQADSKGGIGTGTVTSSVQTAPSAPSPAGNPGTTSAGPPGTGLSDTSTGPPGTGLSDTNAGPPGTGLSDTSTGPPGTGLSDTSAGPPGTGLSDTNAGPPGTGLSDTSTGPPGTGLSDTNAGPPGTGLSDTNAGPPGTGLSDTSAGPPGTGLSGTSTGTTVAGPSSTNAGTKSLQTTSTPAKATTPTTTTASTTTTTAAPPQTFLFSLNNGQKNEKEKELVDVCTWLLKDFKDGNCSLKWRDKNGTKEFVNAEIKVKVDNKLVSQYYEDITKKPTDNKTLIAILASCGALLIMIVILAVCASHHRKPYNENQQHLTDELHTVENGYHDNPTLEVMEAQPEMQEKKMVLNGEFNDSWIVPMDILLKEDMPDEEDTHL